MSVGRKRILVKGGKSHVLWDPVCLSLCCVLIKELHMTCESKESRALETTFCLGKWQNISFFGGEEDQEGPTLWVTGDPNQEVAFVYFACEILNIA